MAEVKIQKIQRIRQMLDEKVANISQNGQRWVDFLDCASNFYKYSFMEQVLIFAQRPAATACAPYDLWNKHFERYIKRGSNGIALLSQSAIDGSVGLRYVFDVADTRAKNGQEIKLWNFDPDRDNGLLEKTFNDISLSSTESFIALISEIADNYIEAADTLAASAAGKKFAAQSVAYIVAQRCGLLDESFTETKKDDFDAIKKFAPEEIYTVATRTAKTAETILRKIENSIKNERSRADGREKNNSREHGDTLQAGGRLLHPGLGRITGTKTDRTLGQGSPGLFEGTPGGRTHSLDNDIDTERSLGGRGSESAGDVGISDERNAEKGPGAGQSDRHDGLGGTYEQSPESGRRDNLPRVDLSGRIRDEGIASVEDDEFAAEEALEPSSAAARINPRGQEGQLSLFPTENEQAIIIETKKREKRSTVEKTRQNPVSEEDIKLALLHGRPRHLGRYETYSLLTNSRINDEDVVTRLRESYAGDTGHSHPFGDFKRQGYFKSTRKGILIQYEFSEDTGSPTGTFLAWPQVRRVIDGLINDGSYISKDEILIRQENYQKHSDLPDITDKELQLCSINELRFGFNNHHVKLYEMLYENDRYDSLSGSDKAFIRQLTQNPRNNQYLIMGDDERVSIDIDCDDGGILFHKENHNLEYKTWSGYFDFLRNQMQKGTLFEETIQANRINDTYYDFHNIFDHYILENLGKNLKDEIIKAGSPKELIHALEQIPDDDLQITIEDGHKMDCRIDAGEGFYLRGKTKIHFVDFCSWSNLVYARLLINGMVDELPPKLEVEQTSNETDPDSGPQETAREIAPSVNYVITDGSRIGQGTPSEKARNNVAAIRILKDLHKENVKATPEQQEELARYVGWGGLANIFDENNSTGWQTATRQELKELLTDKEFRLARASTLTAFYTPPSVINAIYGGLWQMGFEGGNILEPAMGTGNFFGLLPESVSKTNLYGVELDEITGQIAKQLYQKADISVCGFEDTSLPDNFFDVAVGNVPFGDFKVTDRAFDKHNFLIHDYFFAKTLDKVRPGGVVAFVTSKGTLDKANPAVRKYLAQRAELLGAIRLPNNIMLASAGTEVTCDILFLQKRERQIDIEPDWVGTGVDNNGIPMNRYFIDNSQMILGKMVKEKSMYGNENETACVPLPEINIEEALADIIERYIQGDIKFAEEIEADRGSDIQPVETIPADPAVRNYTYTLVNGEVFFRRNSVMERIIDTPQMMERTKNLIEVRNLMRDVIDYQLENYDDETVHNSQQELSQAYDKFVRTFGRINDKANAKAFDEDSSYYLLCGLETFDEDQKFISKADIFTKRTIKGREVPEKVDTSMEALVLSVTEKAGVDMDYMSYLTGFEKEKIVADLEGMMFRNPARYDKNNPDNCWETQDQYLSGNVRDKLVFAQTMAGFAPELFTGNVQALENVLPKEIPAAEIDVRLGSTWIDEKHINQFIKETLKPSNYAGIEAKYFDVDSSWSISNKNKDYRTNTAAYVTYGTSKASAYHILEDSLNLRDVRLYKENIAPDQPRVIDHDATTVAQQKQDDLKKHFKEWIFKDPQRREELTAEYNHKFNNIRPREYDGSKMNFFGMNPEIRLGKHQKDAIARIVFGGNTLLAHEVGAGKTFEMAGGVMETKRLGISQKCMWVVPNHLTEQTAAECLKLYPSANILVTRKKDFESKNRKKFCSRIATGEFDAVIIGFSQFEKIPISQARQERLLTEQIDELTEGIERLKRLHGERVTVKRMEKLRKTLEVRMEKLNDQSKKDDVITFEELGIDRLVIDEAHNYKNLFYYTKMRNVAGLAQTEAKKSTDLYLKCRYMDEITHGKGIVFATGTPISNSMSEMFTMMSYLQDGTLRKMGLKQFDAWASTFGETTTASDLAPDGIGYKAKTRFSKFYNLPELMNIFKEVADIKLASELNLPRPEAEFHTISVEPTEYQKELIKSLSERATKVQNRSVPPEEDNMLKITTAGRKIGLDQRLYDPQLPDQPGTKVNVCVDNVFRIWEEGADKRLTQLIFCDFSTPNKDKFNLYDDVKEKLLAKGIPEKEIAFIHDADNEQKKKELFAKVQSGHVRVLMGSTAKLGAGTNVQKKLITIHDLDCPWRPSDMEQRGGRIIRQGNENEKVHIYRYVTKGTFDAYLYQTLEHKQKFISQVMTSKTPLRSCEDMDETVLQYSEIKALCAGDPRIKEKMDLDLKVAKLGLAKNSYTNARYALEDNIIKILPAAIADCENKISCFENDLISRNQNTNENNEEKFSGMSIGGKIATAKESAGKAILAAAEQITPGDLLSIGQYRGFDMYMGYSPVNKYYFVDLKNENGARYQVGLGTDIHGNIQRLNNSLNGIEKELEVHRFRLDEHKKETLRCEEELQKPFQFEQELRDSLARVAELNIELNRDAVINNMEKDAEYSSEVAGKIISEPIENSRYSSTSSKISNHNVGFERKIVRKPLENSNYSGKIVAIDDQYILHNISSLSVMYHDKTCIEGIDSVELKAGDNVRISYKNGRATIRQLENEKDKEISR